MINAVCFPLASDCFIKCLWVFLAIKDETSIDKGVTTTTSKAILASIKSINSKVPNIVIMPVKSWVKPSKSPSAI